MFFSQPEGSSAASRQGNDLRAGPDEGIFHGRVPALSRKATPNLLTEHRIGGKLRGARVRRTTRAVRAIAAMRKEQTMSEQPHDTEPVTIVLATRNQGKVRELAEPLRAFGLCVVGLDAFPIFPKWRKRAPLLKKTPCSRPAKFPSAPALSPLPTIPGSKWMPSTAHQACTPPATARGHAGSARRRSDERNTMKNSLRPCRPCGQWNRSARFRNRRRRLYA